MDFWKMHGAGNDFIIVDNRENKIAATKELLSDLAAKICERHYGVGADGFICVENSSLADIKMLYYNADGSFATMCGNGLRCFAKYVSDNGIIKKDKFSVETGDGIKAVEIKKTEKSCSWVSIDMGFWDGEAKLLKISALDLNFDAVCLHMGVPHAIIFTEDDKTIANLPVHEIVLKYGPIIEKDTQFPSGINVNFVRIIDSSHENVHTWERGAGYTLACGTGACASALVSNRFKGLSSKIEVNMPGGTLSIEIMENNKVLLEGTAQIICKGQY